MAIKTILIKLLITSLIKEGFSVSNFLKAIKIGKTALKIDLILGGINVGTKYGEEVFI